LLKAFCEEQGIAFLSTPFDLVSIDVLKELNMEYFKIPSGEITNLPYLRKIARIGIPVILSTGMSTLEEIDAAIEVLVQNGLKKEDLILLHCNTEYPTPMCDVNLNAMQSLAQHFNVAVGYSDHTTGIEVPIAAVAMGACVIEKHFTLDRNMSGPDHKASLEPDELKKMVQAIRNVELAMGSSSKFVTPSEKKNQSIARKSIVASTEIAEGELLTEENLTVKRPGTGLSPMLWDSVVGTRAVRSFQPDDLIEL